MPENIEPASETESTQLELSELSDLETPGTKIIIQYSPHVSR